MIKQRKFIVRFIVLVPLITILFTPMPLFSAELQPIKLNKPNLKQGSSMMDAFANRRSDREYSAKPLSEQDISDLLWAAYGINRDDGRRTAPTATNAQEIDLYLFNETGGYYYNAKDNVLEPRCEGDLRKLFANGQDFVLGAPVILLMVGDIEKLRGDDKDRKLRLACMDAGIVSQNINLFCASRGLATVPRAMMDDNAIRDILNLKEFQYPILNNPVGYRK